MKKLLFSLVLITTFSVAQKKEMRSIDDLKQFIEKESANQMEEKNVPGLAVAIIDKGNVVYKNGLGYADVSRQKEMGTQTGFNIGSISKMFTAWGIMKLVDQGKVKLDVPVEQYLTRWKLPSSNFDHNKVTIRALLSHTAGISVHGYPGFHPDANLPTLEASLKGENGPVRENEEVKVIIEPQTKFKYSGGGYTILQLVIEEISGTSFEEFMNDEVFKPLGMKQTSFTLNKSILKKSAKPYDEEGQEVYLERFTAKAAAGLHTTLEDLIRFAKAGFEGNDVLSKETVLEMTDPLPITKSKRSAYGLGYSTYFFGPAAVQGHAGSNTGWESGFMMDFKSRSGIIILTNGSNGKVIAISMLRKWMQWKNESVSK